VQRDVLQDRPPRNVRARGVAADATSDLGDFLVTEWRVAGLRVDPRQGCRQSTLLKPLPPKRAGNGGESRVPWSFWNAATLGSRCDYVNPLEFIESRAQPIWEREHISVPLDGVRPVLVLTSCRQHVAIDDDIDPWLELPDLGREGHVGRREEAVVMTA
jgi:hypothetical protein